MKKIMEISELEDGQVIRLQWNDSGMLHECITEVVMNRKNEEVVIVRDVLYLTHPGQEDVHWGLFYDSEFAVTEIIGQNLQLRI